MRVLSLFSGGGLGDYGLTLAGMEIVGQVERDPFCQNLLKLRWPDVQKWEDVKNVKGKQVFDRCGAINLISGGFPCQPFSCAGKRKAEADERNMWPEMHRIISEIKPAWVLAENVRGIVKPYIDTVLADLEALGYASLPLLISACSFGAPHKRERLWIVAHTKSVGRRSRGTERQRQIRETSSFSPSGQMANAYRFRESQSKRTEQEKRGRIGNSSENVADPAIARLSKGLFKSRGKVRDKARRTESKRRGSHVSNAERDGLQGRGKDRKITGSTGLCSRAWSNKKESLCYDTSSGLPDRPENKMEQPEPFAKPERSNWWAIEPDVGRVAYGIANRVDRLKVLGNGQVVQVVEWIGKQIMEAKK